MSDIPFEGCFTEEKELIPRGGSRAHLLSTSRLDADRIARFSAGFLYLL